MSEEFRIHQPQRREVQRQHKWKHGHDPQDDDATPESGWEYITLKPPESSAQVEEQPSGGPDTGIPCQRCATNTYRAVASCTIREALAARKPVGEGQNDFGGLRQEYLDQRVVRLKCPCGHEMSMREDILRRSIR